MKTVAQTVIGADHFYTIAAHTGNVIQAVEGVKGAGTVRLGKYEHKPEQEWSFIRVGDGVYRIRNRASGKLLDLTMTGTANGTWLHLWEDVGGTSQMWTVQPTPEGKVRLRSSWAGGKCVDTVGMGADVGTVLQIWQEVPGDRSSRDGHRCITVHPGRHDPHLRVIPAWIIHHGYGAIRASNSLQPLRHRAWPRRECRPAREHHGDL